MADLELDHDADFAEIQFRLVESEHAHPISAAQPLARSCETGQIAIRSPELVPSRRTRPHVHCIRDSSRHFDLPQWPFRQCVIESLRPNLELATHIDQSHTKEQVPVLFLVTAGDGVA